MKTIDLHKNLLLAYTESSDGNMDERFNDKAQVMSNRRKIYNQFDLNPRTVIEAKQIHSDRILKLTEDNTKMWVGNNIPGVDGFITNQPEAALLLKVADCLPVIIYDPDHHVFGIFHVGWQGAIKNIHLKGLSQMEEEYESNPGKLLVWLGPSACGNCYESIEKPEQVGDQNWKPFIKKKSNKWKIDVEGYVTESLKQAGIKSKSIKSEKRCTIEDEGLFSHTRSKSSEQYPEARFLILAKLR